MSKLHDAKKKAEQALKINDKQHLYRKLKTVDSITLLDLLWESMVESESSHKELKTLREKIQELANKSGHRARCISVMPDNRALVKLGPIAEEVIISPNINKKDIKPGGEVLVVGGNDGRMLAEIREPCLNEGRFSKVIRKIDNDRVVVGDGGCDLIMKVVNDIKCEVGDEVRYDIDALMVLEIIGSASSKDSVFALAEKPQFTFDDIKGLEEEKSFLRERIVYPAVYKNRFKKYGLNPIRGALFHGPPGCGKAAPMDSLVLTPTGYVEMRDIKSGSIVSTPDGGCAKVLRTFPQGEIDIYKVTFSDKTSTECCLDHLWKVRKKDSSPKYRIMATKEIIKEGLTRTKNTGIYYKYNIPTTLPVKFSSKQKPLILSPYLLGVLLGDGTFGLKSGTIRLACSEPELVLHCKKELKNYVLKQSDSQHYRLVNADPKKRVAWGNKYITYVRELGLWNKGSNNKFIPDRYKYGSIKNRIELLQGLFDSDGSANRNHKRINYTTISEKLAADVQFIVESLGGFCSKCISVLDTCVAYKLYISLPPIFSPFRLSRKINLYNNQKELTRCRKIIKIEFSRKAEAQCILLDHPGHLYMTNNFIVTHNTMLASAIFNEMAMLQKTEVGEGFFVINGPEILSKWVGNTEETIRKIFKEARKSAEITGLPSIIFWDEIDSIAGKRKDSATYNSEKTVIPTLLSELQGIKDGGNVILIGATNRPDTLDPAILRPGRLGDAILEIPKPNYEGALAIINSSLDREDLPNGLKLLIKEKLAERIVKHIYNNSSPLAKAKSQSGEITLIMRKEMVNGALFAQFGEELVRKACMTEIYDSDPPTMEGTIKMIDKILLTHLGVLDARVKNGFEFNTSDLIIDVSMDG